MRKYSLEILGAVAGGIGGWWYSASIGCLSGSCPITSNPVYSTLYGALLGGLLLSLFRKSKS